MDSTKKTLGKRKIPIRKIEKKSNLMVTFSKRRAGLFKKASELSVLCGAQIGILVQSPAGKMYTFGNPSVESVLRRFQSGEASSSGLGDDSEIRADIGRLFYTEAVRELQIEKEKERKIKENGANAFWFVEPLKDVPMEDDEEELEEYWAAIETLRGDVLRRIQNMEKPAMQMKAAAPANTISNWSETVVGPAEVAQYTAEAQQYYGDNNNGRDALLLNADDVWNTAAAQWREMGDTLAGNCSEGGSTISEPSGGEMYDMDDYFNWNEAEFQALLDI